MRQRSKSIITCLAFASLAGCINSSRPYLATQCYLGQADKQTNSYTQICFVGPEDPRGKFLYYSESVVGASRRVKGLLCKQEFVFTQVDKDITIEPKRGACGMRGDYKGSSRYTIISGMKFDAEITNCRYISADILSCDHPASDTPELFEKLAAR